VGRTRRNTGNRQSPRITVGLSQEDHVRLSQMAEDQERSLSWLVRRAVHVYLEHTDGRQLDQRTGSG
jgi:predicted transcriptional regulator